MREIKFRGKDCTGEWWYGNLEIKRKVTDKEAYESHCISGITTSNFTSMIDKNTVGQFTGLKDKNGKEIYEGDIIECLGENGCKIRHQILFSENNGCLRQYSLEYVPYCRGYENRGILTQHYIAECGKYVIGNIHDNPELLTNK